MIQLETVGVVRESARASSPDPVEAAFLVERAGVSWVSLHLRDDHKYLQERDVRLVREIPALHVDLEMSPSQEMLKLALDVKPHSVTLVEPGDEGRAHTHMDAMMNQERILKYASLLKEAQVAVGVRIEPDIEQVRCVHRAGASIVELQAQHFCHHAPQSEAGRNALESLRDCVRGAHRLKLACVLCGNFSQTHLKVLRGLEGVSRIKLGHGVFANALRFGLNQSVRGFLEGVDNVFYAR